MTLRGGYTGRVLEVDLTSGRIEVRELPDTWARTWIGGNGFGSRLLWERVPPETDPLAPEAILVIATGPLTGTGWPCSSRLEAIAKSPLTGIYGDSNAGGFFGSRMKNAGYDMVVISGASSRPVWLCIDRGTATLHDASCLWGLDTIDTASRLRTALGDSKTQVASIGPAGERQVRFASIQVTPSRSFGRCGLGAVMGSKRLKAIAVRGSARPPIAVPADFSRLCREMNARIRANPVFPGVSRFGTPGLVGLMNEIGRFPTRNFQNGEFEHADRITGERLRKLYWVEDIGCFACPVRCDKRYRVTGGDYDGLEVTSVEYETLNTLGAGVGIADLPAILAANDRCDRLGLDTISTGRAISFALELAERGLLPRDRFDGLDPSWGNVGTVLSLIEQIAGREGLGDLLAEGVRRAAAALGPGASEYAMEVKGMEISAQDGRAQQSMGLAHITSNRGADHLKAFPTLDETGNPDEVARRYGPSYLPEMADPQATKHKAFLVKDGEDFGAVVDSVGVCKSGGTFVLAEIYWPEIADGLRAAVGWDLDEAELRVAGERITNLMRAYNARHGITRCDDRLPARLTQEPSPASGCLGQTAHAEEMLDEYYELRGWDAQRGWPTAATLERLGLPDVVPTLEGGSDE